MAGPLAFLLGRPENRQAGLGRDMGWFYTFDPVGREHPIGPADGGRQLWGILRVVVIGAEIPRDPQMIPNQSSPSQSNPSAQPSSNIPRARRLHR